MLHRPHLLLGADRALVIVAAGTAMLVIATGMNTARLIVGVALWLVSIAFLRSMAKADPQMRRSTCVPPVSRFLSAAFPSLPPRSWNDDDEGADVMLPLKHFKSRSPGVADLLNWCHLVDSGIVLCKDGSLLAGWFYRAPTSPAAPTKSATGSRAGSTPRWPASAVAGRPGLIASRIPTSSYPPPELSHFPDPVSRLIEAERRAAVPARSGCITKASAR